MAPPFDAEARREGRKAMEKALTAATRVRRRFTAGRPRAIQDRTTGPMEAMNKTVQLLDKLRALTQEAGLDPDSVHAGLIYQLKLAGTEATFSRHEGSGCAESIGGFH